MKDKWKFNMDMKRINKLVLAGSHREFRRWCHDEHGCSPVEAWQKSVHYARDHTSFAGLGRLGVDFELVLIGTWEKNKAYQNERVRILVSEHFGKMKHGDRMNPYSESYEIDFAKKDPHWVMDMDDPVFGKHVEPEEIEEQEEIPFNFMEALRAL